ncbi:hypothetical protein D9615_007922 [Tricholomella constricta]|uniref:Uncharacterized protein n=1 Tax=Tricholomella constricta TaxID=117010 RepID=A0A8H5H280_9AGAR|nr:hypothetical protein D9615_007922 [Tricholomella constricta]
MQIIRIPATPWLLDMLIRNLRQNRGSAHAAEVRENLMSLLPIIMSWMQSIPMDNFPKAL